MCQREGRGRKIQDEILIREINRTSTEEIALVARRMRQTLVEVLGEARGGSMYSQEWLEARVRWHLDGDEVTGQVLVAERAPGEIVGHTIVRIDRDDRGKEVGLFSTTFVVPEARRLGVATHLLKRGEAWMRAHGLRVAVTYTDVDNERLQRLYLDRGYTMTEMPNDFVRLAKSLVLHINSRQV